MDRPDSIPTRHSLLSRLKNWSDDESWRDFFDTYWRLIYNTAVRLGLDDSEAQEVVQETVISVARKIQGFQYDPARARFKTWLNLIIRRRVYDQIRKRQRVPETIPLDAAGEDGRSLQEILPQPSDEGGDSLWERDWQRNLVEAALSRVQRQVSPKHFLIYQQRVLEQRSIKEISRDLSVTAASIYLTTHRIGRRLKAEIRRLEDGKL